MSRSRWLLLKSTFIASTQRVSQQHSSLQSACMMAMSASHRSEDNPIRGAILRKPGPLRDNPLIIEDVPTHPQKTKPPQGPHLRRLPHRPAHRHRRAPTKATSLDPRPSDRRRGPRIILLRVSRRKPRPRLLGGGTDGTCSFCASSHENICDNPSFTGYTHNGGFAESPPPAPTVNTDDGDTYSFEEIRDWLTEAGFTNARLLEAPGPSPLVLATKP
jgi:hypothetical protein